MKTTIRLILFGLVSSLALGRAAQAPLSPEELEKSATHIVSGVVEKATSKIVPNGNGFGNTDRVFKISLRVEIIKKGAGVAKGEVIVVQAWRPERRV